MFIKSQFETLFAYHFGTNLRLMERAADLDQEGYTLDPGYGHGSIHDLFYHVLRTDFAWHGGLDTGRQPSPLEQESFPDLHALRTAFELEQQAWQALLERLTPEEIEGDLELTRRNGETATLPRWRILQHVVLHGMQHHTELAQLLTERGQSPGDIDFIFYR